MAACLLSHFCCNTSPLYFHHNRHLPLRSWDPFQRCTLNRLPSNVRKIETQSGNARGFPAFLLLSNSEMQLYIYVLTTHLTQQLSWGLKGLSSSCFMMTTPPTTPIPTQASHQFWKLPPTHWVNQVACSLLSFTTSYKKFELANLHYSETSKLIVRQK